MSPETLFNAYIDCRNEMETALMHRGRRWGIAFDNDQDAVLWRKYRRLATKIEQRLLYPEVQTCPICGWKPCLYRCPRNEVNDVS